MATMVTALALRNIAAILLFIVITDPPKNCVGGRLVTVAGVCRRRLSVGVCNTPRRNVTHQGQHATAGQ